MSAIRRVLNDLDNLGFFRAKSKLVLLGILSVTTALFEAIGIGSIMPFMAVATNPDIVDRNTALKSVEVFLRLDRNQYVVLLGLVFCTVTIASNALSAASTVAITRFSASSGRTLSAQLLWRALTRPYGYFLDKNSGDMSAVILMSTRRISEGIVSPLFTMLSKVISSIFILALLIWTDPLVALCVVAVVVPVYGALFFAIRGRLNNAGAEIAKQDRNTYRVVGEALLGIKDLQILGRIRYVFDRYHAATLAMTKAQVSGVLLVNLPRYAIEAFGVIAIVSVILVALATSTSPSIAVSLAALYAYAGYRLMPAIQGIFANISIMKYNFESLEAVIKELGRADAIPEGPQEFGESQPLVLLSTVSITDLSFTYPGENKPALQALSMEIPKGRHIGIVGPSGSGKSTLLDLFVGLLNPDTGGIFIDGTRLCAENLQRWRSLLGYVPQSVYLSDSSIEENIAFGLPPELIDRERVVAAAKAAQIFDFIVSSPEGFGAIVGDRGIRLSGGQRQRLGIARALYHDPQIVVLDEATNALDSVTEASVMSTVKSLAGKKTIVSVAHRLTTVRDCDEIYVLGNGRLVAKGAYEHLEQSSTEFRELLRAANEP